MPATTRKRLISEFIASGPASSEPLPTQIDLAIQAIRSHLGMDVAFVSEFADGRRYFRHVDGLGDNLPIRVGGSDPLEDGYCQRIVDGRLPELMHDAAADPEAAALPVTKALPVGAHVGVPIRLSDRRIYGTFCCFSYVPDHSLNERDLQVMRAFAEMTGHVIESDLTARRSREEKTERIRRVFAQDQLSVAFQPIFQLYSGRIVGVEALARFSGYPQRGPDIWFAEAAELGIPFKRHAPSVHRPFCRSGLGLEITEHASISDYAAVRRVLKPLRERGLKLAHPQSQA